MNRPPAAYPFATRLLSDAIGMEIRGVDLSHPLNHGTVEAILEAFHGHSILLFRDQALTPESLIAFSENFGDIDLHIDLHHGKLGAFDRRFQSRATDRILTHLFKNEIKI